MSFNNDWEDFYTDSKNDENLVDYINVNTKTKQYLLYVDVDCDITDSVDENDNYHFSMNVSREIFDIIFAGLLEKGYKRLIEEDFDDDED